MSRLKRIATPNDLFDRLDALERKLRGLTRTSALSQGQFELPGDTIYNLVVKGTIYADAGHIGGFYILSNELYAGSGVNRVGLRPGTYPFYAGSSDPTTAPFRVSAEGVITAQSGTIGGWTLSSTKLFSGDLTLDPTTPAIFMGNAVSYMVGTGIWMGNNSGTYKMHLGDPANDHLYWDGNELYITGTFIGGSIIGWTETDDFTINHDLDAVDVRLILARAGGNKIINWNGTTFTWDGIDLSSHHSRHAIGAADEIVASYNPGSSAAFLKTTSAGLLTLQNLNLVGNILPTVADGSNLGSATYPFLSSHISEMYGLRFIEETIQIAGGHWIIPKSSATLAVGIDSAIVFIITESNVSWSVGDYLVLREVGQVEYMRVIGGAGISWTVNRNVDGSGGNSWNVGTAIANLGSSGDGWLVAQGGAATSFSVFKRTGSGYSDTVETMRMGNLNGIGGYSSAEHGIFIGDYSGGKWLSYDPTNSLRIKGQAIIDGTIQATALTTSLEAMIFTSADGLLLLGPGGKIDETSWYTLRDQKATLSGAFHLVNGRWPNTQALLIEDAVTNECDNPSFGVNVTDSWGLANGVGGDLTRTLDTTTYRFDTSCCKLTSTVINDSAIYITNGPTASAPEDWTFSVWLKASSSVLVYLRLLRRSSPYTSYAQEYVTVSTKWKKYTITGSVTDSLLIGGFIYPQTAGIDVWVDGVTLSQSSYDTSTCIGSLAYCAWSGTAHNSPSTRVKTECNLDTSAKLVSGENTWSVSLWWQPAYDADDVTWPGSVRLFDTIGSSSANRVFVRYYASTNKYTVFINNNHCLESAVQTFKAFVWQHVVVTFDFATNSYKLYVNGVLVDTDITSLSASIVTQMNLGSSYLADSYTNASFTELAIFDSVLTAEEISTIFHSSNPLVDIAATKIPGIYLFDGQFALASSLTGARTLLDTNGWWAYADSGDAAFGLALIDSKTWGGFTINKGDLVLGHNKTGSAAILWDQSTGKFGFYGNGSSTVQVEIGTDGKLLAGGGKISLDSIGLSFNSTSTPFSTNAIKWYAGATKIGEVFIRQLPGSFSGGLFEVLYGTNITSMTLYANNVGASSIYFRIKANYPLYLYETYCRMTSDLRVLGGIVIGSNSVNPVTGSFALTDGITAPSTISGFGQIYIDSADGDLKIRFGDGTVKTIVTD